MNARAMPTEIPVRMARDPWPVERFAQITLHLSRQWRFGGMAQAAPSAPMALHLQGINYTGSFRYRLADFGIAT